MPNENDVCEKRIAYDSPTHESLSEVEADLYEFATKGLEEILATLSEIQNERTSAEGEITRPLTRREIRTISEVHPYLRSYSTILEAIEESDDRTK